MAETKLLESGKRARKLIAELDRPLLTIDEMESMLMLVDVEQSVLKSWFYGLEQIVDKGAREFYRTSPAQAQTLGLDSSSVKEVDDENDREPWFIPKMRRAFKSSCRQQFALKMNSLDALSQIGALAFDDGSSNEKWISVNPEAWTAWATRGSNALVHGRVKSGKSNLSLLLAEGFLRAGFVVVSNIIVTGAPVGYVYVPKLSDMLKAICNARLAGKEVLILMDECNLYWQKIETIMPKNISLSKLVLTFGKMHGNLVFISHYSELVPSLVARTAVATFEKKSAKEVYVSISEGPIKIRPRLLTNVPACTLKYDPDQLAFFSIDLSVDKLFDFMSSIPEGENQWKAVLEYVAKHHGEIGEEQLDPKDIALWMRKRGKSIREIASLVQRSPSTVHEWVGAESALAKAETEQQ
jgi:hypothetical protein